jgi:hypothetical protein
MLLLGQPGVGTSTAAEQITHLAAQENRQVVAVDGKGEEDFAAGIIALNLTARPDARIVCCPPPYDLWRWSPAELVGCLMGPGPSLKRPGSRPTSPSSPSGWRPRPPAIRRSGRPPSWSSGGSGSGRPELCRSMGN